MGGKSDGENGRSDGDEERRIRRRAEREQNSEKGGGREGGRSVSRDFEDDEARRKRREERRARQAAYMEDTKEEMPGPNGYHQVPSDDFAEAGIQPPPRRRRSKSGSRRSEAGTDSPSKSKRSKSKEKKGPRSDAPIGYKYGAFHTIWNDPANGKYASNLEHCAKKTANIVTFLVYFLGFGAMIYYAVEVDKRSTTLGFNYTVVPVIMHVIGVGSTVLLKFIYEMSEGIGHLEKMFLILRSRMWLFPGVCGGPPRVSKRSDHEAARRAQAATWEQTQFIGGHHKFAMMDFLKWCQFPEFRILFRALETFPWARVGDLKDSRKADHIQSIAQHQVCDTFPILDFLNVMSSLPQIFNPYSILRLSKKFFHLLVRTKKKPEEKAPRGLYYTRAEDIEIDDVDPGAEKPYYEREEPPPWGTLRLEDSSERFTTMQTEANFWSCFIYALCFGAYMTMITGELAFYGRLELLFLYHDTSNEFASFLETNGTQYGMYGLSEHEVISWVEDYERLHEWRGTATILLILMIPLAIQASSLLAENSVLPMLVVGSLKAHIDNYSIEFDQYMTVLAVNKGMGAKREQPTSDHPAARFLANKKAMTRDMAMSWRMDRFFKEIGTDGSVINGSVAMMILNFACHIVTLNQFVLGDGAECVPFWIVIFSVVQTFGLIKTLKGGIECNEIIDGGIDTLMHNWQLRFLMIGWSGGFLQTDAEPEEFETDSEAEAEEATNQNAKSSPLGMLKKKKKPEKKMKKVVIPGAPAKHDGARAPNEEPEMEEGEPDVMAFVSKDPDVSERHEDISKRDPIEAVTMEIEEKGRIDSIVRVLMHYEAAVETPFSVFGVTLTQDMVTLVLGFFGGSIMGVVTSTIDDRENMRNLFMCHGFL